MTKTKIALHPLSKATPSDISLLRERSYQLNSNSLPSILRLWEDETASTLYYIGEKYALIRFRGHGSNYEWIVNGRQLLSIKEWQDIKYIVLNNDEDAQPTIRLVSDNVFSKEMYDLYQPTLMEDAYFDYIYDCHEQAACIGGKFEDMRRQTRLYFKKYGEHTQINVDDRVMESTITKNSVMHLFDDWLDFGTDGTEDPTEEARALTAFFNSANKKFFGELVVIRIFYKNKLVAFSVSELIDKHHAINHFHKTNLNLTGISYFTFFSMMEILNQKGVKLLNFQEDVGILGLRAFKQKMRPVLLDKRYTIQL